MFWLALSLAAAAPAASDCARISVHDGDSVRCDGERIRLVDIEAPELRGSPRCRQPRPRDWCDYGMAIKSRDALRRFLASGPVRVERRGRDRYGRTLARITVNGRDAGAHLISLGLARRYR